MEDEPLVAAVLPPREGFGPGRAGAIGLLVNRHAAAPGFRTVVLGGPQDGPLFGTAFEEVPPVRWLPAEISYRYAVAVASRLRKIKPDLIEVHNRPLIASALAKWLPHTPVSLVMHNDPVITTGSKSVSSRVDLLKRLRLVMVPSDYLRRRFLEGISPEAAAGLTPVEHLPNCIDMAALPPPVTTRDKLILFVGRIVADKGPDVFITACEEALPALSGWRAELIGADGMGLNTRETEFLRGVRAMGVASGIRMVGYRDNQAVLEAMTRASMVVVPSRWNEPFGLTALEAMACGTPVLTSSRGGLPEIVGEAGIVIDPDDPVGIADRIVALAHDPERQAALSLAGRARARRFDVSVAMPRLAELRRKILNER